MRKIKNLICIFTKVCYTLSRGVKRLKINKVLLKGNEMKTDWKKLNESICTKTGCIPKEANEVIKKAAKEVLSLRNKKRGVK